MHHTLRSHLRFGLLVLITGSWIVTSAHAQVLTLPVYRLTIDTLYLNALNGNPWTDRTFPAVIEMGGEEYSCHVRYRGNTARDLPKKSWKIIFDQEGPERQSETNLNSEYRDISLCRNHFVLELCRFAGIPTPESRHVSFYVNNRYMGVHLEVEQVDDLFIERYNLGYGALWKAKYAAARFAPLVNFEDIFIQYEKEIAVAGDIDTLLSRFAFLQFGDSNEMGNALNELVDIEEILTYFALQFVMNNVDGLTKNYFFHHGRDGRWRIFPWDCDASIGNNSNGDLIFRYNYLNSAMNHQTLLNRLIGVPEYRNRLHEIIDYLIIDGYDHLVTFMYETYKTISNDVSNDPEKRGSNEEFESEKERILEWLNSRMDFLDELNWFNRIDAVDVSIQPEYTSEPDSPFRIIVRFPQPVYRVTAHVIDHNEETSLFTCFDDGTYGDMKPGDSVYTREIDLENIASPCFIGINFQPNRHEYYPMPAGGWLFHEYFPTPLPVVRIDDNPPELDDFAFTGFYRIPVQGIHYFGFINITDHPVNLSGCTVRLGEGYKRMQIRELSPIEPGDTLIITNNVETLTNRFRDCVVTGIFAFQPEVGDEVRLTTYGDRTIASTEVEEILDVCEMSGSVVINEINYHSSDEFDPGDWIELYNNGDDVNISGWTIKDNREDHAYTFHEGAVIRRHQFVIVSAEIDLFREAFPDAAPVCYGLFFGFGANGDCVRLFDDEGRLIDCVYYDDDDPWPREADGRGATLELVNPLEPNYGPENWRASGGNAPHGTPGLVNSCYLSVHYEPVMLGDYGLSSVYPNPFNNMVRINWNQPVQNRASISVYDISGRMIDKLCDRIYPAGSYSLIWKPDNIPAGLYFVSFQQQLQQEIKGVLYLK